jgi:hypothetical protein
MPGVQGVRRARDTVLVVQARELVGPAGLEDDRIQAGVRRVGDRRLEALAKLRR